MDNLQQKLPKKSKRFRLAYTTDQVTHLENLYKNAPYISNVQRREIAATFDVPEKAIKVWFQNRRMKEKRERDETDEQTMPCSSLNNQIKIVSIGSEQTQSLPIYINLNHGNDDKNTERNVFMEDQFKNMSLPSILGSGNEQPRSLPILTNSYEEICGNYKETHTSTCSMTRGMAQDGESIDSKGKTTAPDTQSVVTPANVINPTFEKTTQSTSDNTCTDLPIDLCKKPRSKSFSKSSHVEQQSFETESENEKNMVIPTSTGLAEQMTPKNLAPIRNKHIPAMGPRHTVPGNPSSIPGFISVVPTVLPFHPQPYLENGVIWKPMSVMPVAATHHQPSTLPTPCNSSLNMSPAHSHFANRPCNKCDCRVKPGVPQIPSIPQQSPNTQYIITAVPFQPPTSK